MPDILETVAVCVINGYAVGPKETYFDGTSVMLDRVHEIAMEYVAGIGIRRKVFLIDKNRSDDPGGRPGMWDIPGGKINPGETVYEAAVREAMEETNLTTVVKECICISTRQRRLDADTIKVYCLHFINLEVLAGSEQAKAGSDLEEIRWVTGNTVRRFVTDDVIDTLPAEIYSFLQIRPE